MERLITQDLLDWKQRSNRKPLILQGARQVGKTYIIKQFGSRYYDNMVYCNFEQDQRLAPLFEKSKNPQHILEQLVFASGEKITPNRTLIFFDEIQECPDALNSLKYFCEEAPEYHIISAGSLLGVRLSYTTFPVGKVNFMTLQPMSFTEFLLADRHANLVEYMKQLNHLEPIPSIFHEQLLEKLKSYYVIGGMPEAVLAWTTESDLSAVQEIQSTILTSYEQDFSKHVSEAEANKISLIWNGIPSQLARENKKFIYQVVKEGARAREYEAALTWLRDTGLIEQIYNIAKPALPVKAYEDLSAFKIYALDIGLLGRLARLSPDTVINQDELFSEFKGALTENYCLKMLQHIPNWHLNYYTFDRYEIDFLAQAGSLIIPIEVKSGQSGSHASLTRYNEAHHPAIALRLSTGNLTHDGLTLNIPLYLAEYTDQLVHSALS